MRRFAIVAAVVAAVFTMSAAKCSESNFPPPDIQCVQAPCP